MKRHLLYHVMPVKINDIWRYNLQRLTKHMHLFNGRRYVTVVQDDNTQLHALSEVVREAGFEANWQAVPLDRDMRDSILLRNCLASLRDESGITFHAHTKGVLSVGDPVGIMKWRNALYQMLLEHYDLVEQILTRFPCCGSYFTNKFHLDFPDGRKLPWHYQGSFYWFRNQDVFTRDWERVLEEGGPWLAEYFLPMLFGEAEAGYLGPTNVVNPYDPNMDHPLSDPDDTIKQTSIDTYLTKVNLGSGEDVRKGWINVDLDGLADVACDLAAVGRGEACLPFETGTVDRVLCSHVLEHIYPYHGLLHEICRICRIPGLVEIVVPHYGEQMAMCQGHLHTVSLTQVHHWTESAIPYWFGGQPKRLVLLAHRYVPSALFERARRCFPHLSAEDLFLFVPNTCHEIQYQFYVIANTVKANRAVILNQR